MTELTYSEILTKNRELQVTLTGNKVKIVILSNIIVSQLKDILEFTLRIEGLNSIVEFGDYDNIVQNSASLDTDNIIIIFWEAANLIEEIYFKAESMSESDTEGLVSKTLNEIETVFANLKSHKLVLMNKFSALPFSKKVIKRTSLEKICLKLNSYLETKSPSNFVMIDIEKIFSYLSVKESIDLRFFYSSKALYSIKFFKEYSKFIYPVILSLSGRVKKVLILDCDNTLWKGVVGEDGSGEIEMSQKTSAGKVFQEIQNIVVELYAKGVLIALCSKNNQNDIEEILEKHPDMILKNAHIVAKRINWNDKASNMISLAEELNLGLESFIFVDDSEFEINYVKSQLPQVKTVMVPKNLFDYPDIMRETANLFFNFEGIYEDRAKTEMYKQEKQREQTKAGFTNMDEYLRSLKLSVTVSFNDFGNLQRIAQLTQKTNQFNLTTKRYSPSEIERFMASDDWDVVSFKVKDNYGEYGLTGLCLLNYGRKDGSVEIDTFLMSCRIIGRNIEFAFFDFIVDYLKNKSIDTIFAKYLLTQKNIQVSKLYEKLCFKMTSGNDSCSDYMLYLNDYQNSKINYIEVING